MRIKVPIGLYKIANENNLLNVLKFYYKLKTLTVHGAFKENDFINICKDNLYISYNTAKKYKTLLIKNKFVFIKDNHIHLISYDKLWDLLNVPKFNDRYKLIYTSNENFDNDIILAEIKFNLKKQEKKLQNKYINNELNLSLDTATNAKNKKLRKVLLCNMNSKLNISKQFQKIQTNLDSLLDINFQITLSCKGVANILGFKSQSKGHWMIKRMISLNKINSVAQRALLIAKNVSKIAFNSMQLDSSFFLTKNNNLMKFLPNLLTIIY